MAKLEIITGKTPGAIKTVIYGPEGIGKSTLAACFPQPLFIDTEGSTRHMDVARTKKPTSWTMLLEQVACVRDDPSLCATLVLDTADWAEQLCMTSICAAKQISGIEDMGYGKGYVYLAEEFGRLLNLLEEVISRGVHVVLTAHAAMRKFEQPDEMGAYDRWELKLQKKTAPLVKEWADLLLFANYKTLSVASDEKGKKFKAQGGRRVMYTTHHPCWDAKNRFGLPDELPLEYAPLARYIEPSALADPAPAPAVHTPPPETPPAPSQSMTPPPAPEPEPAGDGLPAAQKAAGALGELHDLMQTNDVRTYEVQAAIAARGYFPGDMPLESLPEDFVRGVLVGAWAQVFGWIKNNRPIEPF